MLSADPRRVPEAYALQEVSYHEAMELAYFGAKVRALSPARTSSGPELWISVPRRSLQVIHPKTMVPAYQGGEAIPIYIKNTFNPAGPGTRIYLPDSCALRSRGEMAGFSTVDNVAVVNVEGSGMVGVPGIAWRLFDTIHRLDVSIILIAQASSEQSICFAIKDSDAVKTHEAVHQQFERELKIGHLSSVSVVRSCAIIAAIGDRTSAARDALPLPTRLTRRGPPCAPRVQAWVRTPSCPVGS